MSKLSIILLVLCMATVALGTSSRRLKQKWASAEGEFKLRVKDGRGYAGGTASSTNGHAKVAVEVVAEANSFAKSDLVIFFKKVSNKETLVGCYVYKTDAYCCKAVSSYLHKDFWATAMAHAKAFASIKTKVAVDGEGKACGGGEAASRAFAEAYAKVVIDAIVEAYEDHNYESAREVVKEFIYVFAEAYASVSLIACAGNDSEAEAHIVAAAKAYAAAIVDIYLRLNAHSGCRGDISSNNSQIDKNREADTESYFGFEAKGKGKHASIYGDGTSFGHSGYKDFFGR